MLLQGARGLRMAEALQSFCHCHCSSAFFVQACEWTGDCLVEGCANRCQVQSFVGDMSLALEDRAWDLEWWQVCPNLAQTIHIFEERANTPAPEPLGNLRLLICFESDCLEKKISVM
jgi:hypothetical protein